jgi:hypothetical protein
LYTRVYLHLEDMKWLTTNNGVFLCH